MDKPRFGLCDCGHEGIVHAGLTDYCHICDCPGFHRVKKT